ncbi:dihydrolipoamide acetyltransferase family protein [Streptomyces sp. 4N509B]|uniref:dihydrolipoamide acetyltransferase family protein n=1 Tax=Streptomyces sp. 4N509B TaxID=3457413 RepID=UPI003FD3C9C9
MTTTGILTERLFRLPDLGEGLTDAEILQWRVAVDDTVEVDQVVVEVETAKAAVEVPVPYAGTVLALHAEPGARVAVGEPLISVRPPQEDPPAPRDADGAAGRDGEAAPDGEDTPDGSPDGSGNVLVGYGTARAPAPRRRRGTSPARATPARSTAAPGDTAAVPESAPEAAPDAAPLVISPLVRRLARDHGIDVARLTPSGPHGVVLRRDVERAIARGAPAERAAPAPAPTAPPARPSADEERVPLRGLRRAVAEKLSRSRTEIPDATTWVDVDATGLLRARDELRAAAPESRIGLLALLARVCVAGLRAFPELNATVDTRRGEIVRLNRIHLGFAAQTERGLVVPVVRDAHRMTTAGLAAEIARLTDLARSGELPPESLTSGTFTLNNYGVFGVDGATPIINHPEAALLGVGRVLDRPWAVDGALTVRKITQLSLTFDHRVCDGGVAGGFLRFVADRVERPATLLAEL